MFITIDEEGGNVDRLGMHGFEQPLPSRRRYLGSTGNPSLASDAGTRAANELKSYGINVDLAPVATCALIRTRSILPRPFGSTAADRDTYAGAFLGVQQNGVIGTLKHWPGIGRSPRSAQDPADDEPHPSQLQSTEFARSERCCPRTRHDHGDACLVPV